MKLYKCFLKFFEDTQDGVSKFDFLDGYRGILALIVTIHHLIPLYHDGPGDFAVFVMSGYYIGVMGFFVLSSFLLTFKMIIDISKTKDVSEVLTIIIKYFIRRFFRIYIPYMVFVTCVKFGPNFIKGIYKDYNTWFNILILRPTLLNHLWTIPVEIKFYFFIPFIALIFHYSKRYWFLVLLFSIIAQYGLYQTILKIQTADLKFISNKLYSRFPIFYAGSVVAIVFFKIENSNYIIFFKHKVLKFILGFLCFCLTIYRIKQFSPYYNKNSNFFKDLYPAGYTCSILIFLMLIGKPNFYTKLFSKNYFLKLFGKYSFGVYLWHPMCINILKLYEFEKRLDAVGVVLSLSLLCGLIFYFLIENPLMKIGIYFNNKINKENIIILLNKVDSFKKIIFKKNLF